MLAPCERSVADIKYELAMFGLWSWALRAQKSFNLDQDYIQTRPHQTG